MIIRKNVTSKNTAPKLAALAIATCIPFSSFAVEEEGFIEKVGNKIQEWKNDRETNDKWVKSKRLNNALEEAKGSVQKFNAAIAAVHQKSMQLVQGKTCGATAGDAYAETAQALRELSSSFGEGGNLHASITAGLEFNRHQLAVLDATDADLAVKSQIIEKYTMQAKGFSEHLASVGQWNQRLQALEKKVLSQQGLTIHYCVLQENEEILNSIAKILSDLESESENIENGIESMTNPDVALQLVAAKPE